MIYAYIRVSTMHQLRANQEFEIEQYALKNSIKIDKMVAETISSTKNLDVRKLGKLLKKIKSGDVLIATELSRFGRNLLQVMSILHNCMDKNCQVWTIKENYKLGADIQSKVLAFAFGLSAEIERKLISQRTKESLARVKAEGRVLGRPKGYKFSHLTGEEERIIKLVKNGFSTTEIARIYKMSYTTMNRFIRYQLGICLPPNRGRPFKYAYRKDI